MGEEVSWNGRVTKTASRRAGRSYLRTTMDGELKRGLSSRHMNMIAIGGAIGTGLFVASGATISQAGPGGALVAYLAMGLMVFLLMQSLGEMSSYLPVPGTFETYATRFVSPSFGFALGWNYWFNWAITVAAELAAASIVMAYWWPSVPSWMWSAGFLALLFLLNVLSARAYGEGEFWFAIIKIVAVIAMIVGGLAVIIFALPTASGIKASFANWFTLEGGFFPNGLMEQTKDGTWTGLLMALVVVMFSFGGTELIGITAGEAEDPQRSIPKAINRVVGRILIFYVGALVVMLAIVPWTKIDGTASPFVQIFDLVGIPGAAAILNLVVLTAAMSAYNSGLYANGRMLHALAHQGDAPRVLGKVNRAGSPWVGVLVSSAVTAIAVVVVGLLPEQAFMYIMSIATISAIINWATIIITQMLFRRRLAPETRANLKFQMPGAPVTNWIVIAFLVLMIVVMLIMPPFRIAVAIGPIWLAALTLGRWLSRRRNQSRA